MTSGRSDGKPSSKALSEEKELVHKAKAGDQDAFTRLYDAYVSQVYRYIYYRVTDEQTAEDLTSQVFLRSWEHLARYRLDGSFLAWLYTIARNAVIDRYRTRKEVVSLDDGLPLASEGPTLDEQIETQFENRKLRNALQELTVDQQEVVTLKFIAGYSTDEIARKMGKRAGAVRALQMRALQALARELKIEAE